MDWSEIETLESDERFQVTLEDGTRLEGRIGRRGEEFEVIEDSPVVLMSMDVVAIRQSETSFWVQLEGDIDLGFSFTKADDHRQVTINARIGHVSPAHVAMFRINALSSGREDASSTNRHNGTFTFQRNLSNNWFAVGLFEYLISDEQDLDLRTTVGGGAGRYMIQTNQSTLTATAGIVLNRERFTTDDMSEALQKEIEALTAMTFSIFRFDASEFETRASFYPNLSDIGRYRFDFETSFRLDLIDDLYWNLTFFDNFDSRPPVDAPCNDVGLTSSFGWKF